ncbi:MAG: hypothetical protein ACI3V0_00695 [Faecousia sp.]
MEMILGIILLITFLAFIVYAAKGGNLMLGLFVMAILWSGLGALGGVVTWTDINTTIFDGGPTGFGPTAIYIIFGSWFGRILVETGIAGTIIRNAVELGGDKPGLTCLLLNLVTALIFTTSYGPGAVVAIGVIVFPIMLSLGIPKPLAAGSFCMSVGCGLYFNQSLLNQAAGFMMIGEEKYVIGSEWYAFAVVAFAIHFLSIVAMVLLNSRKKAHAWAASSGAIDNKNVPAIAMITPILPVLFAVVLKLSMIPSILVAVIFALIATGNIKSWNKIADLVQKTFHDGVADVGLVLAFLMFLQMFCKAAGMVKGLLAPIIAPVLPSSMFMMFLLFGLFSILAMYRGPLTIWGAGTALFVIVAEATGWPLAILYPLFYIPCCTINTNICPTQSWNMWAIGYTQVSVKDFMKTTLPFGLICAFILEMVAYFMFAI